MGFGLSANLVNSTFNVRHVEVSEPGRERLRKELNVDCVAAEDAISGKDVVILALPDTLIGRFHMSSNPCLPRNDADRAGCSRALCRPLAGPG